MSVEECRPPTPEVSETRGALFERHVPRSPLSHRRGASEDDDWISELFRRTPRREDLPSDAATRRGVGTNDTPSFLLGTWDGRSDSRLDVRANWNITGGASFDRGVSDADLLGPPLKRFRGMRADAELQVSRAGALNSDVPQATVWSSVLQMRPPVGEVCVMGEWLDSQRGFHPE
uniref:Uncharacterized protein n=1 Tax=Noctiluca scintillans TaxID=2966 RepID=A0A7S1AIM0_NOCSC|mmetsp:Transcript_47836/g.126621  ORF Transcript_47836/g.126621 Transcript_47836/m.126621 type:complete len:175 (+) Transcript_47836:64-588(+)